MRYRKESGQVLPLIGICLAVIIGFAGMSVDVGYLEYHQRAQQSAADAAAVGGAQQLLYSNCTNSSAATTAADNDAASNGFTNGVNNVTVTVNDPPSSGPYAGNACAVSAQVTAKKVPTFFTRLFGQAGMDESTQAVALVTANNPTCILMEALGQNTNFHGATVTAPKCGISLNGSANFNGASVDAAGIGEVDYSGSNNGGTFTGASPAPMLAVADPCPEIAGCAALAANPPSTSPCNGTVRGRRHADARLLQ